MPTGATGMPKGQGNSRSSITGYTDVMHLVASNQARVLKSFTHQTGTNRTGGRTDSPCDLAQTRPLFSQPCYLVAIDYPTWAAQRLSFEYRVAQSGPKLAPE